MYQGLHNRGKLSEPCVTPDASNPLAQASLCLDIRKRQLPFDATANHDLRFRFEEAMHKSAAALRQVVQQVFAEKDEESMHERLIAA